MTEMKDKVLESNEIIIKKQK